MASALRMGAGAERAEAEQRRHKARPVNIGEGERRASMIGGAALALFGLFGGRKRLLSRMAYTAAGGYLLYRGRTGYCKAYDLLGISTRAGGREISVRHSMIVNSPTADVYRAWRHFENLPRFMRHVRSVTAAGEQLLRWSVSVAPGFELEWNAEITEDQEERLIRWRSLPDAEVQNEGEVHFFPVEDGRATEMRVLLRYYPPAGPVSRAAGKLFQFVTSQEIQEDLRRFKQILETGEIATIEGQPAGAQQTRR